MVGNPILGQEPLEILQTKLQINSIETLFDANCSEHKIN